MAPMGGRVVYLVLVLGLMKTTGDQILQPYNESGGCDLRGLVVRKEMGDLVRERWSFSRWWR